MRLGVVVGKLLPGVFTGVRLVSSFREMRLQLWNVLER